MSWFGTPENAKLVNSIRRGDGFSGAHWDHIGQKTPNLTAKTKIDFITFLGNDQMYKVKSIGALILPLIFVA